MSFRIACLWTICMVAIGIFVSGESDEKQEDANLKFFQDLAETRNYTLGIPVKSVLTPNGSAVIFLRGGARDPVLRLYEMDVRTGKVQGLLTPEAVLAGAEEKLSPEERAHRERMRVTVRGFTEFDVSKDGSQILLMLSSRLFVVRRSDKKVTELPSEGWITPSFSEDGRFVAAVRNDELFVIEVATRVEHQLTTGATETVTHGRSEFIAEEEMARYRGFWWSPDSKSIVYQETDVSPVEKHYIANPLMPQEEPQLYYYPRAGTANARVRLGIISTNGGDTKWIKWDTETFPYLARVAWTESAPLTILVQTRDQRQEKLLTVDPTTGTNTEILLETDPAWLNLDPASELPFWFKDGSAFLWTTERRGGWQLELHARDGKLLRELTPVGCECAEIVDVDEKSDTVITSGGPDPREHHLYRVFLKGGEPVRITQDSGWYTATFSEDHSTYVQKSSLSNGHRTIQLRQRDGTKLADLPSVAEQPPHIPQLQLLKVADRMFNAMIIRPRDFQQGRKYPVILDVYAGPTATVVVALPLLYLEQQWLADQGFIVVSLDGRGTPGRGRDWERVIQGNLIDVALEDQVAGLKALGEKYSELDMTRVGVSGWSFGGYFAAMATMRRPDVFKCGVAGAPVVDWEDYDTHYTERYMNLPSKNPDGYKKANVLTYASQLQRPLLIVHGLTDDNVYFQHTVKLAEALFTSGRSFELLPLLGTHQVPDPVVQLRLQMRILDFLKTHVQK
jgi:dipeptidyl-peptidase 4